MSQNNHHSNSFSLLHVLTFCAVLCVFVVTLRYISTFPIQSDSYTHLSAGKYVIVNHSIPNHADLSYKMTQPSLEWINHSWIADCLLYIASKPHISFGTITLLWAMLVFSFFLLLLILQTVHVPIIIASISACVACLLSLPYWRYHPIIFAIPIILTTILIFLRWYEGKTNIIWYLPLCFLLFANIFGGYIAILAILSLLCIIMSIFFTKKNTGIGFVVLGVSVAASLINPFGVRIYMYTVTIVWSIFERHIFFSLPAMLKFTNQTISKQVPVSIFHTIFAFLLVCVILMLISFSIRHIHKFRFKILPIILPCLFLTALSTLWVRFLPFGAFGISILLGVLGGEYLRMISLWKYRIVVGILTVSIIISSIYIGITLPIYFPFSPPVKQIALINEWNLPDNLFTSYDISGYSLYRLPNKRILLDAQDDLYDELETMAFTNTSDVPIQEFQIITNKHYINTVLVSMDIGGLALAASANKETWALVYAEQNGLLFVRRNQMSETFLDTYELTTIDLTRNLGFDPNNITKAIQELEAYVKRFPDSVLLKGQLATLYRITERSVEAENLLLSIPKSDRSFVVKTELGRTMAAQGKCADAEYWLLSALKDRNERNFARATLDLAVVYAGCFHDRKKAEHYFARFNSYILHPAEREYLRQVAQEYGISLDEQ